MTYQEDYCEIVVRVDVAVTSDDIYNYGNDHIEDTAVAESDRLEKMLKEWAKDHQYDFNFLRFTVELQ